VIELTFGADRLDHNNWVVDFGGLKGLYKHYEAMFDHRLMVAENDPDMETFRDLEGKGLAYLTVLPTVSCEAFAELAFNAAKQWLTEYQTDDRVQVLQAKVSEHDFNHAIYRSDQEQYDTGAELYSDTGISRGGSEQGWLKGDA
jgi:6-pyruvoyltetrahydropterin/6-carboxytetrahydropterin synthase